MMPHELEIMKKELGLAGIDDPDALRAAIQEKLESMNSIDQAVVLANIGRKVKEAETRLPGELYSPASGILLAAAGLCIAVSVAATLVVLMTEVWIVFKILAGIGGVWFFLLACVGVKRIIFRIVNRRDS